MTKTLSLAFFGVALGAASLYGMANDIISPENSTEVYGIFMTMLGGGAAIWVSSMDRNDSVMKRMANVFLPTMLVLGAGITMVVTKQDSALSAIGLGGLAV